MSCKNLVSDKAFTLLTLLLCLCLLPVKVHATTQQSSTYKVTGVVKDINGESVIGASVLEKALPTVSSLTSTEISPCPSIPIPHWSFRSSDTPAKNLLSAATTRN